MLGDIPQNVEMHQYVETNKSDESNQVYMIPYDTRQMEGSLRPGEKIVFHGGVAIVNQTAQEVFIREDFLLYKGGYHITVIDPATGQLLITAQKVPMNSAHFFLFLDGVPVLEMLERNLIAEASE